MHFKADDLVVLLLVFGRLEVAERRRKEVILGRMRGLFRAEAQQPIAKAQACGETALPPEELNFRCDMLASELESFRVMPGVRVKRIAQQLCTTAYDRDDFEGQMHQIQFTECKYVEDLEDHELSHYWEPP